MLVPVPVPVLFFVLQTMRHLEEASRVCQEKEVLAQQLEANMKMLKDERLDRTRK